MSEQERNRFETYLQKSPILYKAMEDARDGDNSIAAQVTNGVLAPAINSFIIWVLQQACERGTKRLYFLARDAYFMYRTARQLCESLHLPIECRYLYCSRYSLRIPVFHLDEEGALDYICRGGINVTMEKILGRSGITVQEQNVVLHMLHFFAREKKVIPYAELSKIKKELKGCTYFMERMREHSKEALPMLLGYLRQEGIFDGIKYAIVDSGWTGSMQKSFNLLLSLAGRKEWLEGYYWGLYELPLDMKSEKSNYHCYYFAPKNHLKEKVYFSNCLFETIFSAPHGMTMGYQWENGKYKPMLAPYDTMRRDFMKMTEAYLDIYTQKLGAEIHSIAAQETERDRKVVRGLLKMFMGNPTKAEAEVYGSLHFSDDVLEDAMQEVAAPLNEAELRANHVWNKTLVMLGIRKSFIQESAWYEGSAARLGKNKKYHIRSYVLYKYLLYFRDMYFN